MTWTIVERRGDIPPAKRGDAWKEVVTFEVMEAGSNHPVATLFACEKGWDEGVQRERAALVAAAPDLYAALEGALDWIDNWSPEFTQDPEWPEAHANMRAALAKARGEA